MFIEVDPVCGFHSISFPARSFCAFHDTMYDVLFLGIGFLGNTNKKIFNDDTSTVCSFLLLMATYLTERAFLFPHQKRVGVVIYS